MLALAQPHIWELEPYVAGQSMEEVRQRYQLDVITKLASNENPLGPSPLAIQAAQRALAFGHLYPNFLRQQLKERICAEHQPAGFSPDQIILGNGSNELITLLVRTFLGPHEALLNAWPSFIVYRSAALAMGRAVENVPLFPDLSYDLSAMVERAKSPKGPPIKMLFLANPNNPTGRYVSAEQLVTFLQALPEDIIVVLDEAYVQYVDVSDYADGLRFVRERPRTVVLRTFSKIFGLAGMRVGYAVCDPQIAELLHRLRDPFNVNGVAQQAALAGLDDTAHIENARLVNSVERLRVMTEIQHLGLMVTPSVGNFVLLHVPPTKGTGEGLFKSLLTQGVIVRPLANYDLPFAVRVTIGTKAQNDHFLQALKAVLPTQ